MVFLIHKKQIAKPTGITKADILRVQRYKKNLIYANVYQEKFVRQINMARIDATIAFGRNL